MIKNGSEIWRALPGVPGTEVSTFGRVRTLDRVVSSERGKQFLKGRVLKQYKNNGGYQILSIKVDGKWTSKTVHRLIAKVFIPNPEELPQINHKDNDRTNNNVSNLEWCSSSYNCQYREKYGVSRTEAVGHPLFAINLATLEVSHFNSQNEASQVLGVCHQNISSVINGRLNQTHGFWFVNDDGHAVDVVKNKLHDIGGTGLKIKHRASIKK